MALFARVAAGLMALVPLAALSCAGTSSEPNAAQPERVATAAPGSAEAPAEVPPPEEPGELRGPGWLGVELSAREPSEPGVLVRDVIPQSPADRAGLGPGDVILSVDGQGVQRPADVVNLIGARRAGARVALAFRRGESDRLVAVVLAARPDAEALMQKAYEGAPAPSLSSLTTIQGSVPAAINAWRGKVVVLEFWASWCVPCRLSAPKLNSWHDRWKAEGLEVLGVTTDPAVLASQAAVEFGIRYAIASDESGKTSRAYRAMSIPTLFVIDRAGVVRKVVVGYSSAGLAQAERLVEELVEQP